MTYAMKLTSAKEHVTTLILTVNDCPENEITVKIKET